MRNQWTRIKLLYKEIPWMDLLIDGSVSMFIKVLVEIYLNGVCIRKVT